MVLVRSLPLESSDSIWIEAVFFLGFVFGVGVVVFAGAGLTGARAPVSLSSQAQGVFK